MIFLRNSRYPSIGGINPTFPIIGSRIIAAIEFPSFLISSNTASSLLKGIKMVFLVVSSGTPGESGNPAAPEPDFTST